MQSTQHGLRKAVLSLLVPMMVASGVLNVPSQLAQASEKPGVSVTNQADEHASVLNEPGFQHRNRMYRGDIPVQFLGINDLHGNLDTTGKAWVNGKVYENAGTVSRLAAYLNQAQWQFNKAHLSNNSFRIQAGDMVGAAPANSSLLAHEPTMHALRAMHFNIGTLGNHEFDHGLGEFDRILKGHRPGADADAVLQHYPHRATGMQEVVANVVRKSDGQQPYGYKPYAIRNVYGAFGRHAKVGFIGIETSELPNLTYPKNHQDYQVLDEAQSIVKYERELNSKGVKAVVVMAHTGASSTKTKTDGDAVKILQKVNQLDPDNNIGLYQAGHSHRYANAKVGKTHLVQAASYAKEFSDTTGYVNPKTGKFDFLESHVYPVMSAQDDPKTKTNRRVARIIEDANRRVASKVNAVIGKTATGQNITQQQTRDGETPIGEVVVDGQLFEAHKRGIKADFAMTNNGGVRADLVVKNQGEITWGAASAVQPFGNVLKVIGMTGQQIVAALNKQYNQQDGHLQIAGMRYTFTKGPKGYQVVDVMDASGKSLDMTHQYRVVINDFLHTNKKYGFLDTPILDSIDSDTDVFVQYIKDMQAAGKTIAAPKADRKIFEAHPKAKPSVKDPAAKLVPPTIVLTTPAA